MPKNTSYRGRPARTQDIRRFTTRRARVNALKMTSVRGAYNKKRKYQINKRMRPMVETKKVTICNRLWNCPDGYS